MGVLLRGTVENFNPQIHTEANSLTANMKKHFALRRKSLDLFARYTKFVSFMYASGRFNGGYKAGKMKGMASESIYDNAFRVSYEGALILPAISYGAAQIGSWFDAGNASPDMSGQLGVTFTNGVTVSTVVTDTLGTIALKHDPDNEIYGDKFNPNDSIMLNSGLGLQFIITQHPRFSSDRSHVLLDGKFNGPAALFATAHLAADNVLTEGGNFFGEGSLRGWQRYTRNKWRINFTSIHRSSVTMTGSAKKQKICWLYNSDDSSAKMWEYQEILKNDQVNAIADELALRFSRMSMDVSSHKWYENYGTNRLTLTGFKAENGLTAPIIGEGWIPQIQDNFTFDYNPNTGLSIAAIEAIMMVLSQRSPSGSTNNTFVAVTDKIGKMVIDKALKLLIGYGNPAANTAAGTATNNVFNLQTGKDNGIGFTVTEYNYLGDKWIVLEDEIFNNPGLFPTNGGVTGTGNMYVLNTTPLPDGVSNFELFARSTREFIRKYENGMHSFDDSMDAGAVASSGFDGCTVHTLRELMPLLYDVRSCAVIRAIAAYTGGALAGNSAIASGAAEFMF